MAKGLCLDAVVIVVSTSYTIELGDSDDLSTDDILFCKMGIMIFNLEMKKVRNSNT